MIKMVLLFTSCIALFLLAACGNAVKSSEEFDRSISVFNYNPEIHSAVLKCSICNGEQVAGFKDKTTGEFHEVMFIRTAEELEEFKKKYKIKEITKVY